MSHFQKTEIHRHQPRWILPRNMSRVKKIAGCYLSDSSRLCESHSRELQWVTKIHIYLILKLVFFADISGTTWAIKKFFTSICMIASLSDELSDEKIIFEIRWQNQLIFTKTLFCLKKSKLLEKIRHFEKIKNVFSWI